MAVRAALACLLCIAGLGATVHGSTPEVSEATAAAVLETPSAASLALKHNILSEGRHASCCLTYFVLATV